MMVVMVMMVMMVMMVVMMMVAVMMVVMMVTCDRGWIGNGKGGGWRPGSAPRLNGAGILRNIVMMIILLTSD